MTSGYNPIIGRPEEIPVFSLLAPRPRPEPGIALVLIRDGQASTVLLPGDTAALRQVRWSSYQWAIRVDVGTRAFSFKCVLPSQNTGLNFQAEIHITYRVTNPLGVVQRRITNANVILETLLVQRMRAESRKYPLHESVEAEQKICDAALNQPRLDNFTISTFLVNLTADEKEIEHAHRMRELERNREYEKRSLEWRVEADKLQAALRRQSIDFYNQLTTPGIEQLLMLNLADRPEDVRSVLEMLDKHFDAERDHWFKMFELLRNADGIEPQDLQELRRQILRRFSEVDKKRASTTANGSKS